METETKRIFGVVACSSSRPNQAMRGAGGPTTASPGAAPPSPPLPASPGRAQARERHQQFVKLHGTLLFAFFSRTFLSHKSVVVPQEVHSQVEKG